MKKRMNKPVGVTDPRPHKHRTFWSEADAAQSRNCKVFLVKVLSCILIALLFLVAIFSPRFATVLSCLGVVVACSIAAVLIDRRFRRQCYGI